MFPPGNPFNPGSPNSPLNQQSSQPQTIAQQMLLLMNQGRVVDRQLLDTVRSIGRDVSLMLSRQAAMNAIPTAKLVTPQLGPAFTQQSPTPAQQPTQPVPSSPPPTPPANRQGGFAGNFNLAGVLDTVQKLSQSVPVLGNGLGGLLDSTRKFTSGTFDLAKVFMPAKGGGVPGLSSLASLLPSGVGAAGGVSAAGATAGAGAAAGGVAGAASAVAAPLAAVAAGAAAAGVAIAGIGAAAMKGAESILGMAQASVRYVEAFAPSSVMAFNLAMRDLNATIGVALKPIVDMGTSFARMLASTLLPITKQLAGVMDQFGKAVLKIADVGLNAFGKAMEQAMPIIQSIVGIISDSVVPVVNSIIEVASAIVGAVMPVAQLLIDVLAPPLKMVADLLSGLTPIITAAGVILRGLVEAVSSVVRSLSSLLGLGELGDALGFLKNTMMQVARACIIAAASLAQFFGLKSVVRGMIDALEPAKKGNAQGIAAATNAQMMNFADFGKSVSIAAATASGTYGGKAESAEDKFRNETLGYLKDISVTSSGLGLIIELLTGIKANTTTSAHPSPQPSRPQPIPRQGTIGYSPIY